jgi:hypothetical protein
MQQADDAALDCAATTRGQLSLQDNCHSASS